MVTIKLNKSFSFHNHPQLKFNALRTVAKNTDLYDQFLHIQQKAFSNRNPISIINGIEAVSKGEAIEASFHSSAGYVLFIPKTKEVIGGFLLDKKRKEDVYMLFNVAIKQKYIGSRFESLLLKFAQQRVGDGLCIAKVELCNTMSLPSQTHKENVERQIKSYLKCGFIVHEQRDGLLCRSPYMSDKEGNEIEVRNYTTQRVTDRKCGSHKETESFNTVSFDSNNVSKTSKLMYDTPKRKKDTASTFRKQKFTRIRPLKSFRQLKKSSHRECYVGVKERPTWPKPSPPLQRDRRSCPRSTFPCYDSGNDVCWNVDWDEAIPKQTTLLYTPYQHDPTIHTPFVRPSNWDDGGVVAKELSRHKKNVMRLQQFVATKQAPRWVKLTLILFSLPMETIVTITLNDETTVTGELSGRTTKYVTIKTEINPTKYRKIKTKNIKQVNYAIHDPDL